MDGRSLIFLKKSKNCMTFDSGEQVGTDGVIIEWVQISSSFVLSIVVHLMAKIYVKDDYREPMS